MSTNKIIRVYGIPNCDTVKKARTWLTEQGLDYEFHDFKKQGVPADKLALWMQTVGWDKLTNRQGTSWRKLDPSIQAGVTDAASAAQLKAGWQAATHRKDASCALYESPAAALQAAAAAATPADRIVVFGSFYTVGGVLEHGIPRLQAGQPTPDAGS